MKKTETISIELPTEVVVELLGVAKSVGFTDSQSLLKNYVREVILAARSDAAANKAKAEVVASSEDLDVLISQRQAQKRREEH